MEKFKKRVAYLSAAAVAVGILAGCAGDKLDSFKSDEEAAKKKTSDTPRFVSAMGPLFVGTTDLGGGKRGSWTASFDESLSPSSAAGGQIRVISGTCTPATTTIQPEVAGKNVTYYFGTGDCDQGGETFTFEWNPSNVKSIFGWDGKGNTQTVTYSVDTTAPLTSGYGITGASTGATATLARSGMASFSVSFIDGAGIQDPGNSYYNGIWTITNVDCALAGVTGAITGTPTVEQTANGSILTMYLNTAQYCNSGQIFTIAKAVGGSGSVTDRVGNANTSAISAIRFTVQ